MLTQASQFHTYNRKFSLDEIERIYAAKELIDSNLPRHFSIFQIAAHVALNEQKLKEGFKEIFGKGLFGYLQDQLLKIAQIEIEQTNRSVKQIAARAGYKKANNFSAAFKKKFGLSPSQWKKQFKREE
jgi:AraC-like DNA-binding protein